MKDKTANLVIIGCIILALVALLAYMAFNINLENLETNSKEDILSLGETAEIVQRVDNIQEVETWKLTIARWHPRSLIEYRLYIVSENDISFTFERKSVSDLLEDLDYFERVVNE